MGDARPLYQDQPDPPGYASAPTDRPVAAGTQSYQPVRLGKRKLSSARVLLFTIDDYPEAGRVYEGTIPDPLPAMHYAQLLINAAEYGQTYAETIMINDVMGRENLAALAACPDMGPEDLKQIMGEAFSRAMGPYAAGLGKEQNG
jgi:hypothetical protein